MPTRLLLIRHGQTTWNAEGRWQGHADPPLSELGRLQAAAAASGLRHAGSIVSSDLRRASETADILVRHLELDGLAIESDLRERDVGPWSGMTSAEIEARWPGWLAAGRRPAEFESDESLVSRVIAALARLASVRRDGVTLVVTHGGVIGAVTRHLGGEVGRLPNLAGRELTSTGGGLSLGPDIEPPLLEARSA